MILVSVLVAALWGLTTPLLKTASRGVESVACPDDRFLKRWLQELSHLMTWSYMGPFLLNQLGSVIFLTTLGSWDLSILVPVVNSMTFIFVFVAEQFLNRGKAKEGSNMKSLIGIGFILVGSTLCSQFNR